MYKQLAARHVAAAEHKENANKNNFSSPRDHRWRPTRASRPTSLQRADARAEPGANRVDSTPLERATCVDDDALGSAKVTAHTMESSIRRVVTVHKRLDCVRCRKRGEC